jgi:catechol 2,3-dioxygenase-like lactoylglutathione lyase family enzyme
MRKDLTSIGTPAHGCNNRTCLPIAFKPGDEGMKLQNTIYVTNMSKSIEFYQTLGLKLAGEPDTDWNEFPVGDGLIALHIAKEVEPPTGHLDLMIKLDTGESLDAIFAAAQNAGYDFGAEIRDIGFGRFFWLRDPDGQVVTIIESPA